MKAHKVPATYYSEWEIAGKKNYFYGFDKHNINGKGKLIKYRNVRSISKEHSFFMEEDFYYIDIFKKPFLVYLLKNEINDFLANSKYKILCTQKVEGGKFANTFISDFNSFICCFNEIDTWSITNLNGDIVAVKDFKKEISSDIFKRVGEIIEKNYFANYLESNWPKTKDELICAAGSNLSNYSIPNKKFFLEFVAVQYYRLNSVMEKLITPILKKITNSFKTIGVEETLLKNEAENGFLAFEPYFYGILLNAARGNKKFIDLIVNNMDQNYVIDLLRAPLNMQFITSTSPCVIAMKNANSNIEVYFPISSTFCIRFLNRSRAGNRNGKVFNISDKEIRKINNKIVSETDDIVISRVEYITNFV